MTEVVKKYERHDKMKKAVSEVLDNIDARLTKSLQNNKTAIIRVKAEIQLNNGGIQRIDVTDSTSNKIL